MITFVINLSALKKAFKIIRNFLLVLLGIVVVLILLINIPVVQNFLAQKAAAYLSKRLQTTVTVRNVRFHLLNAASLEGLYIQDQRGDTLLYAGAAEVHITNWFVFRADPVIHSLELKNATVFLSRGKTSPAWNYAFLNEAFSSERSPEKKTSGTLRMRLQRVTLEQVRIYQKDQWVGTDMSASVGYLTLKADLFDFQKKKIDLRLIKGDNIGFGILEYTGGRQPRKSSVISHAPIDTTPFNSGDWKVDVKKFVLSNSRFFLEYPEEKAPKGLFDAEHLDISAISMNASDITIRGDTITAALGHLAAKERCGLEIKDMHANITVSPVLAACANLYLETGNSVLKDYYAMHYERFPDFEDYIHKVRMEARLNKSEIGVQDIAFFAPALSDYGNLSIRISGRGSGTVDRLIAKQLVVEDGFSRLTGNISMNGLPDIENTFIDFRQGTLKTNGAAAMLYAPALRTQHIANIAALSKVDFKGNFTGFITDFVAYGSFETNLGYVEADINMKLPNAGMPTYSGSLTTRAFDIGKLFFQDYAGTASFSADLSGQGFKQKNVALNVDGHINSIWLYGYGYRNIDIKGKLQKRKFDGSLTIADPNLALQFLGDVDFSSNSPVYDFSAKAEYFDLQALQLTQKKISGSADMKLNLKGNTLDDFIGNAQIYNMRLRRDTSLLRIDSIQLTSAVDKDHIRHLRLATNQLSATVNGRFSLSKLPGSFQRFLAYYLPQYIRPPAHQQIENQNFNFFIEAEQPDDLLSLFAPSLQLPSGARFRGSVDMGRQTLSLLGNIPVIRFRQYAVHNLLLRSNGDNGGLDLEVTTGAFQQGDDSALVASLRFQATLFQDSATFHLNTQSDRSLGGADITGTAVAQNDSFYVKVAPSSFYFNQQKWLLHGDNEFVFAKEYFLIQNLVLENGKEKILVNPPQNPFGPNGANIDIQNINLAVLKRFAGLDDMEVKGSLDGLVALRWTGRYPEVGFKLQSTHVTLNEDTVGRIRLNGAYDPRAERLHFDEGSGIHYQHAFATIAGDINLNEDSVGGAPAVVALHNAKMEWLAPFLSGYVHHMTGRVEGQVTIGGNVQEFTTSGTVQLQEVAFTPDITGVHYKIPQAAISISDNMIDIGSIRLIDNQGNKGILSGVVTHYHFRNFYFRLRMESDNIQVVGLNRSEGDQFYGTVFAAVQARLSGPADNLNMNVFATSQKGSSLFIPIGYGSDISEYGYISFKSYDTSGSETVIGARQGSRINFKLDAIVTPDMETSIILDPSTGDRIWAKGSGNIILDIPADGEMKMNGNYIIDKGTYDFAFKQLQILNYKKQFTINPNSVIKWNGDITDAELDVSAYTTVKTRLYDLIQGELVPNEEIRDAQIPQDVNVLMKMKGSLSEPDLTFNIQLVENRSIGTYAYQKLQRINNDEKQLLNQVASLLLLGQFMPPEGINNSTISSGTINNMSELLASAASSQITNFANKILGMDDLYVGVRYKNYSLSQSDYNSINYFNRNEAGLNLRKNFFNNRLVVEVGGVYDWGQTVDQDNFTAKLAGDFRVQYLLREDGRIRFYIFRNSNYDALTLQNISRQGVGLSYRKSFNGLRDFFQGTPGAGARTEADTLSAPTYSPKQEDVERAVPVRSGTEE